MMKEIESSLPQSSKEDLFGVLIDLVQRFQMFCEQNGLQCFAIGGTLLGTVRHNGFIPWDDDIDLAMMRPDYDKLLQLIEDPEVLGSPYRFLTMKTDIGFTRCFVKLTNVNTTEISIKDIPNEYNHGCFIDIFPVDALPDSAFARRVFKAKMDYYKCLRYIAGRYFGKAKDEYLSGIKKCAYRIVAFLIDHKVITTAKLFERADKEAARYKDKNTREVGLCTFAVENRLIWKRTDFTDMQIHPFENINILIPGGYDNILKKQYGDYMRPVQAKSDHGDTIFNASISYKDYIEKYADSLDQLWKEYRSK